MARLQKIYACLRYLMLFVNGIICTGGFVLLGLGLWIKFGAASFVQVMGSFSAQLINIGYICIGVGAVLALIGFLGCCGAWKENRCLLLLFFAIVTLIFVAEVVGAILVLVYRAVVEALVRDTSKKSLMQGYMGPAASDTVSQAWNTIMIGFKCCGFDNYTDFSGSVFSVNTGLSYPKSCCAVLTEPACNGLDMNKTLIHQKGCFRVLISLVQEKSVIIGSTAAGICVLELVAMIVSVVLFVKLGIQNNG
ncbi:tetraspanin-16 [Lepisosteus oculatus]|uniref:tetraspanin-16 n=1 Tax=Lepisosteus oculatus TaxID=7918 RepID=UPI0035F50432